MTDTSDPVIEEREDGPLILKGDVPVIGPDGTALEAKPLHALCRCGASANKPYCDGSHRELGFKSRGGVPAGKGRIITYDGADISVTYNPLLCAHAAECGRLASKVFNPEQKPWVQPDNGTAEDVRAVVAACPSGALAIAGDAGPEHVIEDGPAVHIQKNGPYWVRNIPPPVAPEAEGASAGKYVLCRCGKSGIKPFCDGSHRDAGWTDEDSA